MAGKFIWGKKAKHCWVMSTNFLFLNSFRIFWKSSLTTKKPSSKMWKCKLILCWNGFFVEQQIQQTNAKMWKCKLIFVQIENAKMLYFMFSWWCEWGVLFLRKCKWKMRKCKLMFGWHGLIFEKTCKGGLHFVEGMQIEKSKNVKM